MQDDFLIRLIGARASGKSHYIASLLRRFEDRVGGDLHASILPATDETLERYRRIYHDPMFRDHVVVPPTTQEALPLLFDLTVSGVLWGEAADRAVTLALCDPAGHGLADPASAQRTARSLGIASAIILVVDPLQVPEIRESVPVTARPPAAEDPNTILGRLLTRLEAEGAPVAPAVFPIPVAVVLTKSDVVRDAGLIEPNRLWCMHPRSLGAFDSEAHADMSGMIEELMRRWHPALVGTIRQRFVRFAFFGVSATGCMLNPNTRRYRYVTPWRVEDPLLWLLAEAGVIPSR